MSGYTPVFDSVFQGTLCGRWPDTGVWLCLLALADRDGRIDSTIPYISAVTGIPAQTLTECIDRFMAPDPASRTQADDGRRLVLIDAARQWGWVVVNHGKYREKARKQMQQIVATNSGRDAERKRVERERKASGDVQSRPAMSSADRLSDSDSDSDSNKRGERRATRLPPDFSLTPERRLSAEKENLSPERTLEKFRDYWRSAPGAKGRKLDWDATWRNWCRTERDGQRNNTAASRREIP
jgi:hypothetical protein